MGIHQGDVQAAIAAQKQGDGSSALNVLLSLIGGSDGINLRALRVSNGIYHVLPATTLVGGTASTIWTPASGKKFRLLYAVLSVGAPAAASSLYLTDGATQCSETVQVPTTGIAQRAWVLPLNGLLSTAAGNKLQVLSPAALVVSVLAIGGEE